MKDNYAQLGEFSDLVAEAKRHQPLFPHASPGKETQARVKEVLGFCNSSEQPHEVQIENRWQVDGILGEEVSWWVGYGPRTHAYVFKPEGAQSPLPGLLALHDHGGYKFYGKEKIADGPQGPAPYVFAHRQSAYEGRAFVNELAKQGFVVAVHDTFLWGSRRFAFETIPAELRAQAQALVNASQPSPQLSPEISLYNTAAGLHEHMVAKYCNVLGSSLAGVVAHEDRIAFNYLLSRDDVSANRCGCLGLSGGGNRSAMLNATHDQLRAAVIVGLMSTYQGLLDHNMNHTWMFFPSNWARYGDWPDLAACRAPSPLLVQYDLDDNLFTPAGMHAADERLKEIFAEAGQPDAYLGQFYPGPHKFDLEMQMAAFAWLESRLNA